LGVARPLQERLFLKANPLKGVAVHSTSFWLAACIVPLGYALQRRQAVASHFRETLYSGPVVSPCASSALGFTYREIFDDFSTGIADRGKSGEEHAAKKSYSHMIVASRIPSITHLESAIFLLAKFARFRAFAMLRQSLQQF